MNEDIFKPLVIMVGENMKMPTIPANEPFLITKLPRTKNNSIVSYEVSYTYDPTLLKD